MFNILVAADGKAWEQPRGAMLVSRFKEFSAAGADAVSVHHPASLRRLEEIPTLLMYEVGADGPNPRIVRLGRLRNISREDRLLNFEFKLDPQHGYLDRGLILQFADQLGLHRNEQHRTHWAIKDHDLPTALIEAGRDRPADRSISEIIQEYFAAKQQNLEIRLRELNGELRGIPASPEKALAYLSSRANRHNMFVSVLLRTEVKPNTPEARILVEANLPEICKTEPGESGVFWFIVVSFLDLFGGPTETTEQDSAVRRCQEKIMREVAACVGPKPWPHVQDIAAVLWGCANSMTLALRLRRRYTILIDHLAGRQGEDGGWEDRNGVSAPLETAMIAATIQRLGDDKHRSRVGKAIRFLLNSRLANGSWAVGPAGTPEGKEGDVISTTFALEALRRYSRAETMSHVFISGESWLMQAQTPVGNWESTTWDDESATVLVLSYFERRGGLLAQVDGFLLMARDFFRKAEEHRIEGGANDRRLAAIATVHAVEMCLYGIFEQRPDLCLSAYREDGWQTLGPREALSAFQGALQRIEVLQKPQRLPYRDQLNSLIGWRDGIIHRAHEISPNELEAGMRAAQQFINKYSAELLGIDLLQ